MIVGAFGKETAAGGGDEGAAYIFARSGGAWSQQTVLTARDGQARASFGNLVAISGETSIVGAVGYDVGTSFGQSAAYLFLRSPDTDGLPDDWERNGVNIDGVFINLPKVGADPMHKDLFVHADWMQSDPARPTSNFKPLPRALKIASAAFAITPVVNPNGKPGVRLHIDNGPEAS